MPNCKICENVFHPFVDFGLMPIANAFRLKSSQDDEYKFHMKVGFCDKCKMVQLVEQPDRNQMFHDNYAFFSSTSSYMISHFRELAHQLSQEKVLNSESFVVEIGCNDGILLQNFLKNNIRCIGIEPSSNVASVAKGSGLEVIEDFFDEKVAKDLVSSHGKADVIVSANVMCHIPYMHSIFSGIKTLLKDDGVFVFEDPYLGDIIQKTSFDQIYDEHVYLFSGLSVQNLARMHDLDLIDIEPQKTHGGSMRYTIGHKDKNVVSERVKKLITNETLLGLNNPDAYSEFSQKVDKIKSDLMSVLLEAKRSGKKVVAYGATSKSTTVTNYFGITPDLVSCIFDTTPIKHNTLSPGAQIPVLPYDQFHASDPDYVLLFAWNHSEEIMGKEAEFMSGSRSWLTYIPDVKVLQA